MSKQFSEEVVGCGRNKILSKLHSKPEFIYLWDRDSEICYTWNPLGEN